MKKSPAQLEREIAEALREQRAPRFPKERSHATMKPRFWYFTELNERGGVRDRFGPFASKREAALARKRTESLFREKHLDQVHSSIERFPSNVPNWLRT